MREKITIKLRLKNNGVTVADIFDEEDVLVGTSYREQFTTYVEEAKFVEDVVEIQKKHDVLFFALERLIESMDCNCTSDGAVICPECNARQALDKAREERY